MLERAKACLNSRAGGTLQCANSSLRSRRILPSIFWTHGAGDLKPSPDFTATTSSPPGRSFSHDRPSDGAIVSHDTCQTAKSSGRPFLDFLYPPSTAAFLMVRTSTCSHAFERLDSNRKRSKRGMAQSVRGYKTKAHWGDVKVNRLVRELRDARKVGRLKEVKAERRAQERAKQGRGTLLASERSEVAEKRGRRQFFKELQYKAKHVATTRTNLLKFMSIWRETLPITLARVEQAWRIYRRMDADSRGDQRLNAEFVCWLSLAGSSKRDRDCIMLYDTIPTSARTMDLYRAMIVVFTRNSLWPRAVEVYKELANGPGNHELITAFFFRLAVEHNRLQLAVDIEAQRLVDNPGAHQEMLWVNLADIPHLIQRSMLFSSNLRRLESRSAVSEDVRAFCVRFFKEALRQEFMHQSSTDPKIWFKKPGTRLPVMSLGRVFEHVLSAEPEQGEFVSQVLLAILQDHERFKPVQIKDLVITVYELLKANGHRPAPHTITTVLQHTCLTHSAEEDLSKGKSISIEALVEDYEHFHGTPTREYLGIVLRHYAHSGLNDSLEKWMGEFERRHQGFHNIQSYLWTKIHVYARRANPAKALEAFSQVERLARLNGEEVDLRCYNALILAFARVDDLQAAVDLLATMAQKKVQPDVYTYHPIMEMMAARGDAAGVLNFISAIQAQLGPDEKLEIAYFGSLVAAYMQRGKLANADEVLERTIKGVKEHQIKGSLTYIFRRIISGYAKQREPSPVVNLFRRMKADGIRVDAATYAGVIQLMCNLRRCDAAEQLVVKEMPAENIAATAREYTTVMRGYNRQRLYKDALRVHARMKTENIRPSVGSRAAYIEAKAGQEADEQKVSRQKTTEAGEAATKAIPLRETISELRELLKQDQGRDVANTRGSNATSPDDVAGAYVAPLIYMHGARKCFDVVKELLEMYTKDVQDDSGDTKEVIPSFSVLSALMTAHLNAGDHAEVARCWKMATELADRLTPGIGPNVVPNILAIQDPLSDVDDVSKQMVSDASKPSVSRRNYLEQPLRAYMASLAKQNKVSELLELVPNLIARGYTLDTVTWNRLIRFLCSREPPLALIAFVLTEQFLMPGWLGWAKSEDTHPRDQLVIRGSSTSSSRKLGMQFTRNRYVKPNEVVPQYSTMVSLASTLTRLRQLRAVGADRKGRNIQKDPRLLRYIGTPTEIYARAVKTVQALRVMPTIQQDPIQTKLLPDWDPTSSKNAW